GDSSDDDQGDGLLTVIPTGDTSPAPDGGVFVHLFEWPWADVEKECTFLAEKGYAAVQVSPPNEHLVPTADMSGVTTNDYPWWVRYQPVTHLTTTLTSRSGTWAEFTSMVDACNSLGVGIYVDAVINHTADIEVGTPPTGTHGTEYHSTPAASRAYGAQYQADDFHTECTISSYEDRQQVQLCELSGLPDLDTGKVEVQTEISNYLQALLDAGVWGFRIDGAKHIRAQDIAAILNGLTLPGGGTPFIFQEVIDQSSDEPVRDWEYAPHGDVTEFAYAFALGDKFDDACGGALSQLESRFDDADMLPSRFAVVFTDNHDNQRGHGVGSGCVVDHRDGQEHLLANIFALAYPYGYPKVMSSYYWQSSATDNNGDSLGPPSSADGGATWGVGRGAATRSVYGASQVAGDNPANCAASYEDGKWVCEHRQTAIANLVQFRQVTDGAAVSDWQNIAADHIAFGRGAKGFVALNRTGSNATTTYTTGMPEGDYCDSVSGQRTVDGSACTGPVISVNASHQIVNYTLASMSALAIHAEARLGAPQLDASQDFDLARAANGPVTATLQTHDGFDAPNQTITFTLESGAGSLGAPVVTATTDISGVASVTYTAPNTLTVAMVSAAYRAAKGTSHESLSAVYVDYRAAVAELLARRLATGEVSLNLGHTLTVTKQGSGDPLITLARFTGNPQSNRAGDSVKSAFVDLYLPDAAAVTTLTVEIACTATCASGDTIWWGNPVTGDWTAVTDAAAAFSGAQATFTLTVSSTPSLTQLSGTPFVVSLNEPLAISLHAFQATSGVPGRLLLVLLILAILRICASAFSRQRRAAR
ncbi:MAG: alpha-amylase family glycosyl hydrolase, partial [Chloroflexota bacterium]|nr:alpha-amylase family glycosyl hydrolase [Chloroflexota bacterium]